MSNLNKVLLMGRLTRDPELRVTSGGLSICKFGIAINRKFKGQDGEMKEETCFIDVDAFGKQADVIAKYLTKGRPIFVEGRLKLDQWESEGQKRSKLGVVLEGFQFVGSSREDGSDTFAADNYEAVSPPQRMTEGTVAGKVVQKAGGNDSNTEVGDDIPF